MCGIVGFITDNDSDAWDVETISNMTNRLIHRGPDDEGIWIDTNAGVALGHRRLSILDLTREGHQPMHSRTGRYVIVFNGEIYNFRYVRKELDAAISRDWRGNSDTEVILAAVEEWGLEEAVKRFIGMFAFAIWDRKERMLHLVRDRIGEKPLYYGWQGTGRDRVYLFGSELKALKAHPSWKGEIDSDALALYMRYNYVPAPFSIYKNIRKVLPGRILSVNARELVKSSNDSISQSPYWDAKKIVESMTQDTFMRSAPEAVSQLEILLKDAISLQMVADVPLGAFLSGGIDSSTVVALMQALSSRPVRTFTIGFFENDYNEAQYAKHVARHLGTDHTELYVTPREALDVIPKMPILYDEPFADSSQIPTYLISQMTRKHVTVSLSGDAGDELFAGYNRYFWSSGIWNKIGWMPRVLRRALRASVLSLPPQKWDIIYRYLSTMLPIKYRQSNVGDKAYKLAEMLAVQSPEQIYLGLVSHWNNPALIVRNSTEPLTILTDTAAWAHLQRFEERMMYLDLVTYLPDDILVKVDRAAMGVSLETRVPFLDHRVVEFAWQLPLSMKIRNGQGKWILRQILYKYVPKELVERPKTGFGVPIDSWLRGRLRPWAEELLSEKRLLEEGFFIPGPIRQKWKEHLSGKRNWQYHLWDVLMFQAWLAEQKMGAPII